jgi:solute carrier family 25 (mitochondrial phosphate transporter), member 23/24/25/41
MLKGNGVNVVRIAPFSAFEFFFYDLYKRFIFGGKDASPLNKLICGGMTGMTASFLTYPLDLIRTVMAVKVDSVTDAKPTIVGTGRKVFKDSGIRGLYRGLPASLYVSLEITSNDHLLRASFLMLD